MDLDQQPVRIGNYLRSDATAAHDGDVGSNLIKRRYRQRIVHVRTDEKSAFAIVGDGIASDGRGCLAHWILRGFQYAYVVVGERRFAGYVEANHGDRNAGLEDDARGFGVDVNVELRCGCDVSAGE
jgi:hypothetical protein